MLTVIWWRDIPAQVIAKDRASSHKIVLHARFQTAIDRAATKAGLKEWNAYLEQWRKEQRICGDDVKAEAEAEAERLEAEYHEGGPRPAHRVRRPRGPECAGAPARPPAAARDGRAAGPSA